MDRALNDDDWKRANCRGVEDGTYGRWRAQADVAYAVSVRETEAQTLEIETNLMGRARTKDEEQCRQDQGGRCRAS